MPDKAEETKCAIVRALLKQFRQIAAFACHESCSRVPSLGRVPMLNRSSVMAGKPVFTGVSPIVPSLGSHRPTSGTIHEIA